MSSRYSLLLVLLLVIGSSGGDRDVATGQRQGRNKRALPYPINSSNGYFVAIAVPLGLRGRDVFVSYNFEVNYILPQRAEHFTSGWYTKWFPNNTINEEGRAAERERRSANGLFTRRLLYHALEDKLDFHGFNGTHCLLKSICEASEINFRHNNGVLGDILHIFLTPSSSRSEFLPPEYYDAEKSGAGNRCHEDYHDLCPRSLLDMISQIVQQ